LEEQADLYAGLLDSLRIEKAAVIAYSAGGHSAIPFILKYSERCSGLVLLSGHTERMGTYNPSPSPKDRVGAFLMTSNPTNLLLSVSGRLFPGLLQSSMGLNQEERAALRLHPAHELLVDFYQTAFHMALNYDGITNDIRQMANSPDYPLEKVQVPTLVIHGEDDPHLPFQLAESNTRRIPNSTMVRIPHGGHYACLLHTGEIKAALGSFLQTTGRVH
jgi:pimeloyl-ACP methyl ester carboxylesterase